LDDDRSAGGQLTLRPRLGWPLLVFVLLAVIIVPWLLFDGWMQGAGAGWLDIVRARPLAAAGAVVTLLAADVVLPVPSSLVAVFAGGVLGFARGAFAIWFGLMLGCGVGYAIGAHPGRRLAGRVVGPAQLAALERQGAAIGPLALVLARGVPVLAEASVIAAGAARMDRRLFFAAVTVANAVVALAHAGVGALAVGTGSFLLVFTGLAAVPALAWALHARLGRRRAP
jgi:uncharacterized membrane protein YdjX (TVP38/TMEM64 family)